ncbi:MAG: tRNA preQ1(34) S-adenosylmethionine ribosyltransferase-isomerase QueA [Thiocapsa sp.]|nr:tRNA preQ1(34) S-adenosylmethionine ribosyltransferase-isomerase QueA [Thiocapsa sp.]MCG6897646.1 tRNA preQ1(34) S-adenosylmethionine ribosyltransferase-isomerase QueA [Thiocapsa sp.]MCG6984638.1 tRNA preQ1(34) S-adenosylmethionine ribosyltransferase-isomerase QueA [Thiocapsa sp.]
MRLSDFKYDLPAELIAQRPLRDRGASRLLAVDGPACGPGARRRDLAFADLPQLLRPGDLLIFNNTRVMRARLFGRKETGGRIEVLIERVLHPHQALAHVRSSKPPAPGRRVEIEGGERLLVLGRDGGLFRLRSEGSTFAALMSKRGHLPLPPYIRRPDDALDETRYQTVYARRIGAVAAPTAGLHFDETMLERLAGMGVGHAHVTLHVGAGTFQPIRAGDLDRHEMHAEWVEVNEDVCQQVRSARQRGGRIVAVGTTSVRSLETAAAGGELKPFRGDSRLFIRPGFRFRAVDAMITNFHLPESTLLMLVSAFAGHHVIMDAYRHAVASRYRFFSYGDAMFLIRNERDLEPVARARS